MHKDCLEQSMPSIQSIKLVYIDWILAFASMTATLLHRHAGAYQHPVN